MELFLGKSRTGDFAFLASDRNRDWDSKTMHGTASRKRNDKERLLRRREERIVKREGTARKLGMRTLSPFPQR